MNREKFLLSQGKAFLLVTPRFKEQEIRISSKTDKESLSTSVMVAVEFGVVEFAPDLLVQLTFELLSIVFLISRKSHIEIAGISNLFG